MLAAAGRGASRLLRHGLLSNAVCQTMLAGGTSVVSHQQQRHFYEVGLSVDQWMTAAQTAGTLGIFGLAISANWQTGELVKDVTETSKQVQEGMTQFGTLMDRMVKDAKEVSSQRHDAHLHEVHCALLNAMQCSKRSRDDAVRGYVEEARYTSALAADLVGDAHRRFDFSMVLEVLAGSTHADTDAKSSTDDFPFRHFRELSAMLADFNYYQAANDLVDSEFWCYPEFSSPILASRLKSMEQSLMRTTSRLDDVGHADFITGAETGLYTSHRDIQRKEFKRGLEMRTRLRLAQVSFLRRALSVSREDNHVNEFEKLLSEFETDASLGRGSRAANLRPRVHFEHARALAALGRYSDAMREVEQGQRHPYRADPDSVPTASPAPAATDDKRLVSESWRGLRELLVTRVEDRRIDAIVLGERTQLDLAVMKLQLASVDEKRDPASIKTALNELADVVDNAIATPLDGPVLFSDATGHGKYVIEDAAWIRNRILPKLLVALGIVTPRGADSRTEVVDQLMKQTADSVSHLAKMEENGMVLLLATGKLKQLQHWERTRRVVREHDNLMSPLHNVLLAQASLHDMRSVVPGGPLNEDVSQAIERAESAAERLADAVRLSDSRH